MDINNCVLIATTIFLGVVALFVPYLAELLKRKLFKPVLRVNFKLGPPDCHKTFWSNTPDSIKSVYYFRFEVENIGKTTCQNVENSLEKIWRFNSANEPVKIKDFTPVGLKWSVNYEKPLQSINPERRIYCNIGHLPTREFQLAHGNLINLTGYEGDDLRLELDLLTVLNVQPNCLPPGKYLIQINTYSENYRTLTSYFRISWSGIWNEDYEVLFQELVIEKINKPTI
jgi:hypothetical protein